MNIIIKSNNFFINTYELFNDININVCKIFYYII